MDSTRFVQTSPIAIPLTIIFVVVPVALTAMVGEVTTGELVGTIVASVLVAAFAWTFARLSVRISDDAVTVAFGLGLPRRTIATERILATRTVRNKWYAGWGIRYIRTGWMWNVWGLSAVELDLAGGRHFRIGTDRPDELAAAISRRIDRGR